VAFILKDRVKETTTSTGTGAISLAGATDTFDRFQDYMSNADTTYYAIIHTGSGVDEWEVGLATWNTGNTLTRTTVLSGSNGTSAVNFSAGTKNVFMTYPADKAVIEDASNNITVGNNIVVGGTVDGRDIATDGSKLDGIESGATADQTAAEIRTLVESASDSNVFTDADHTKLNNIEAGAEVNDPAFKTISVSGQSNVVADADADTLTLAAGSNVTITTNASTDTVTIASTDTNTVPNNATITISAGNALTGGGNFTTDQSSNETITINHQDTSTQASVNNSGRTYIQDITLDTYGHVTGISSATETVTDTNTNQLTTFVLEDGDGTEVTISHGKEVKFVEGGGIDINWTDTSTGSDGDPYDLTFTHADTSSQASLNNSNGTVIQDVTLDGYGHVTALGTVNLDSRYYTETEADSRFLLDSELTDLAAVKAIDQGLTTSSNVQFNNITVDGNLTVGGTTTTINSTTVTVDDPIFTLGGDTAPASDDNKDRGIEFRWHNGSAAKIGFFGFDDSVQKFTFIPDATNTSEVFTGTAGTIVADLEGDVTGTIQTAAQTNITSLGTLSSLSVTNNITVGGTVDGRDIATDGTKLDGIEASADVTDATNVAAAGALMDSEVTNLAQVKAFDSSDYATAAQGTTADAAMPKTGGTFTGAVTLLNTGAGSGISPYLNLKRDSSSPAANDYLGALRFLGEDGASNETVYTSLVGRITDATSGSEDGRLDIYQATAGAGTLTYVLRNNKLQLNNEQTIEWTSHGGTIYEVTLAAATPSTDRTITLPDATGTVAITGAAQNVDFGTVTADGLTTGGNIFFDSTSGALRFRTTEGIEKATARLATNDLKIETSGLARTLFAANGDISFYEDTGTTAKFFWDASAEALGLGTTSPTNGKIEISNSTDGYESIRVSDSRATPSANKRTMDLRYTGTNGRTASNTQMLYLYDSNASSTQPFIQVDGSSSTHLVLDSSGNVGINESNPSFKLDVEQVGGDAIRINAGNDFSGLRLTSTSGSWSLRTSTADAMIFYDVSSASERMRIDSSGNVGIGTSSIAAKVHIESASASITPSVHADELLVEGSGNSGITIGSGTSSEGSLRFADSGGDSRGQVNYSHSNDSLRFYTADSLAATIDSSGNLLVGKTSADNTTAGGSIFAGVSSFVNDGARALTLVRNTSDGDLVEFRKGSTTVGSIGTSAGNSIYVGTSNVGVRFSNVNDAIYPMTTSGVNRDAATDLGISSVRFKDLYLSGTATANSFSGDGSSLTGISASAEDGIFWENDQAVTSNYTITNNKNAMSAGPITINSGVTVTVGDGEAWTVV